LGGSFFGRPASADPIRLVSSKMSAPASVSIPVGRPGSFEKGSAGTPPASASSVRAAFSSGEFAKAPAGVHAGAQVRRRRVIEDDITAGDVGGYPVESHGSVIIECDTGSQVAETFCDALDPVASPLFESDQSK
jgi:hypothetical protein